MRTRAIQRKLRGVQELPAPEPAAGQGDAEGAPLPDLLIEDVGE